MKNIEIVTVLSMLALSSLYFTCQTSEFVDCSTYLKGNHLFGEFLMKIEGKNVTVLEYKSGFNSILRKGKIISETDRKYIIEIQKKREWSLNTGLEIYPWKEIENLRYILKKENDNIYTMLKEVNGGIDALINTPNIFKVIDSLNEFEIKYLD